jgi:hypothetical protein
MLRTTVRRILILGTLAASCGVFPAQPGWAQTRKAAPVELPDAHRTKSELDRLLSRYPPALRGVLALDPSLLANKSYLAPYPALASFINEHPEITRDPAFYAGRPPEPSVPPDSAARPALVWHPAPTTQSVQMDNAARSAQMWQQMFAGLAVFLAFVMAMGLVTWLVRTWIDYRRWSRLAKVQTDVHSKLLDRFTANDDLLAYIQSPAGSKFLESSPITLDAGPRSVGAPMGRILWSVQAGIVLVAAGVGLRLVGYQVIGDASHPFHAMGLLAIALGIGFAISAIISFMISQHLGLIERASPAPRAEGPNGQG